MPRTLFGGLLRCSACGGPMIGVAANRYGCHANKDRGDAICANRRTVRRDVVDRRLVVEVRDQLTGPDALAELHAAVRAVATERKREMEQASGGNRRRLAEVDLDLSRLVEAVASIGGSPALVARIRAAEAERALLAAEITPPADVAVLLSEVGARYRRMLLQLDQVLLDEDRDRTRAILADIVGPVTIVHEGGEVFAELEEPAARMLVAAGGGSLGGVAGARNFSRSTAGRRRIRLY